MKKFLLSIALMGLSTSIVMAYDRGDTVYTCTYKPGFMWTSAGSVYTANEYIVLEKIGSNNYRIESRDNGSRNIVSGNKLFSGSAIIDKGMWGKLCDKSYISR